MIPLILLALSLPITRLQNVGNEILREQAYLYGMGAIATGVLAALVAHRWRIPSHYGILLTLIGSIAWLAVIFTEDPIWSVLGEGTLLLLTIGTAILLIGLDVWQPHLPCTGWFQSFGRLSYEIYLTHVFIMLSALTLFHSASLPDRLGYLLYVIVLACSLILGWLVARLFSQPVESCIRGRWLGGRSCH